MTSSAHPLPESFATIFWSQRKREWPHHYFTPEFQEFWTSHPRESFWLQNKWTITPQRLSILQDAYNSARHQSDPLSKTLQQKSKDYFINSHGFQ
jgi:hypothetical protein